MPSFSNVLRIGARVLPSFTTSYVLCSAVPIILAAWVLSDAYCPRALELALADLGVGRESFDIRGWDQRPRLRAWGKLGAREALVGILTLLALVGFAGVVARMIIGGTAFSRGLRGWALFVAVVAGWLAAWSAFDSLRWSGVLARARAQLGWYEATVRPLRPGWPAGSMTLPGGLYHQGGWRGREYLWATRDTSFHPAGDPARYIYRRRTGGLLLEMRPEDDCLVEYSPGPPTSEPLAGTALEDRRVISRVHLRGPWSVVRFR